MPCATAKNQWRHLNAPGYAPDPCPCGSGRRFPTLLPEQRPLRRCRGPLLRPRTVAAMNDSPSDDLAPPSGLLLVAHENGAILGCVGLRLVAGRLAEVKRVFVVPGARRRGLGERLMSSIEDEARRLGVSTLRLDTREDLTEARHLYARVGYQEVAPFNDDKYAEHWFAKTVSLSGADHDVPLGRLTCDAVACQCVDDQSGDFGHGRQDRQRHGAYEAEHGRLQPVDTVPGPAAPGRRAESRVIRRLRYQERDEVAEHG